MSFWRLEYLLALIKDDSSLAQATDKHRRNLLMNSVIDDEREFAQEMLKSSIDVNAQDKMGYSAFHFAVSSNHLEMAKMLLEKNAHTEIRDVYGNTPLCDAVFNSKGNGDMIKLLLSYGADRNNANNYGVSPISLANTIDNYDIKQYFKD